MLHKPDVGIRHVSQGRTCGVYLLLPEEKVAYHGVFFSMCGFCLAVKILSSDRRSGWNLIQQITPIRGFHSWVVQRLPRVSSEVIEYYEASRTRYVLRSDVHVPCRYLSCCQVARVASSGRFHVESPVMLIMSVATALLPYKVWRINIVMINYNACQHWSSIVCPVFVGYQIRFFTYFFFSHIFVGLRLL